MSSADANPHWDQLATSGQTERLATELELWRSNFAASLSQWQDTAPPEFLEPVQQLLDDLQSMEPRPLASDWDQSRLLISSLNHDAHLLRDRYLQQLGPTPLGCLNAVIQQLELLRQHWPNAKPQVGASLFTSLKTFENWATQNHLQGDEFERLRLWMETLALGLLSGPCPDPAQARQQLTRHWQNLQDEHSRQSAEQVLAAPTGSARWNSWLLLLQEGEKGTDPGPELLDSLAALDSDVDEIMDRLGEQPEVAGLVADYRDASEQLHSVLEQGKRLKGWSQILAPILIELDALVPRSAEPEAPVSQVRGLCQQFEAGTISVEQLQSALQQYQDSLTESRRQSRVQSAQHPTEAAFVEALGKMQAGLDVLTAVERAGQASRLEMGCTLIEEGLAQIAKLEAGDG